MFVTGTFRNSSDQSGHAHADSGAPSHDNDRTGKVSVEFILGALFFSTLMSWFIIYWMMNSSPGLVLFDPYLKDYD